MTVKELNRSQLIELKQSYLCSKNNTSWWDLANADHLVSDKLIYKLYENTEFVEDDFFGNNDEWIY